MAYSSFEDLEVWQRSCDLTVRVYDELKSCKDYGLKDQMTRAAVSIASNITEGAERDTKAEYIRYLHIAKGSAAELRTQIDIAGRIKVISETSKLDIVEELRRISGMLHGLIKSLKRTS